MEKTKYIFMSQTTGQNYCVKVSNKSFENMVEFKHLGMALTNENTIYEEIESRLNMGSACYHAV
jgi:hypothetical protein